MKLQSFAALIVIAFLFASCKSSTEVNGGTLITHTIVKPKVGSRFVYQQESLDSSGNVSINRTDSIWRVFAADTTVFGRSHVWLFGTLLHDSNSYFYETHPISYRDDGDIDYMDPDYNVVGNPWIRIPVSSQAEQTVDIDTTVPETEPFRVLEKISTKSSGTADIVINGKTLQGLLFTTVLDASAGDPQSPDDATIHSVRTWLFIPEISFFGKIEETHTGHKGDGHPNNAGDRATLVRYELK